MKNYRWNLLFAFASLGLGGCQLASSDGTTWNTIVDDKEYSFDAVKLISPDIGGEDDPKSFQQYAYRVSPRAHLLLRLENMSENISSAVVSDEKPIQVVMWLNDVAQAAAAQSSLKLCPLQKTWMMLATWTRAYPFDRAGIWTTPGGDFASTDCVPVASIDGTNVHFTVNNWIQNDVRGRGVNYGLALTSSAEIDIVGDQNSSASPRLKWTVTTRISGASRPEVKAARETKL